MFEAYSKVTKRRFKVEQLASLEIDDEGFSWTVGSWKILCHMTKSIRYMTDESFNNEFIPSSGSLESL